MWFFLFFPLAILFLVALTIGTLAAVLSALGPVLPVLLIGFGAWMVFSATSGRRKWRYEQYGDTRGWGHRRHEHQRESSVRERPRAEQRVPVQVQPAPAQPAPRRKPELPIDVQVKVEQIRRKVEVLLGYADRFPPFSHDLYLVKQTAGEYLPRTIAAYLALPPDAAERILPTTGKTALAELKEQLDLLDAKLDEIALDLQRQDLDHLLANRRFLEERFSDTSTVAA